MLINALSFLALRKVAFSHIQALSPQRVFELQQKRGQFWNARSFLSNNSCQNFHFRSRSFVIAEKVVKNDGFLTFFHFYKFFEIFSAMRSKTKKMATVVLEEVLGILKHISFLFWHKNCMRR